MKKHIIEFRKLFIGFAFTGILFLAAAPAIAAKPKASKPETAMEPRITYVGSNDNSTLVSVAFESAAPVKFEIILSDENGTLYRQIFETATFSKYFKLVNEGNAYNGNINLTIRNLANGESHNYAMSSDAELVNLVEITKL